MDKVKAEELEKKLSGNQIGDFNIIRLLDHGKSAAVFLATKNGDHYAVKVFDDELILRYGDVAQFKRIQREIELKDSPHDNLVSIIEGGVCPLTNNHFIAMDFIEGSNLKNCLCDLDQEDIWHYISQLANAAKHLDELGYVHRDIKPENIMISLPDKKLTLMDLGVVKPTYGSDLTDSDGIAHFIGTLQYSSPEFLLRNEDDTPDGWRALTFYQIGAVLHDMIMQTPIFQENSEPYARLVIAVRDMTPIIKSNIIDQDLVHLAQCCLLKKPQQRLDMLSWDSFFEPEVPSSAKTRIVRRMQLAKSNSGAETATTDDEAIENELKHRVIDVLKTSVRVISADKSLLPKVEVTSNNVDNVVLDFSNSPEIGIEKEFTIVVNIEIISASSEAITVKYITKDFQSKTVLEDTFFKGIYNKEKLCSGYEGAIYESIDSVTKVESNG